MKPRRKLGCNETKQNKNKQTEEKKRKLGENDNAEGRRSGPTRRRFSIALAVNG